MFCEHRAWAQLGASPYSHQERSVLIRDIWVLADVSAKHYFACSARGPSCRTYTVCRHIPAGPNAPCPARPEKGQLDMD